VPKAINSSDGHLGAPSVGTWRPEVEAGSLLQPGDRIGAIRCNGVEVAVTMPPSLSGFTRLNAAGWVEYGQTLGSVSRESDAVDGTASSAEQGDDEALAAGCVVVEAETDGTVFLRPKPEVPAFVMAGDTVSPNQTLALIEVMKTFTPVRAPVAGVVTRVLVDDGDSIEDNSPLFWIEPAK